MTDVHVLVATISRDLAGELISAAVARSQGMVLVGNRVVGSLEIKDLLVKLPTSAACALVLVGPSSETRGVAARWLRLRERLVVVQVDTAADIVQITARDVGMEPLLTTLRELLDRGGPWATLPGGADGSRAHPLYIACTYNPQRPGLVTGRASSGPGH